MSQEQVRYPKRLIEVDLPIRRVSAHSQRDKSSHKGHISTLHIWWARRPLAACRAVLCSLLWPDPVDLEKWLSEGEEIKCGHAIIRPAIFLNAAKELLASWARNSIALASPESQKKLIPLQQGKSVLTEPSYVRELLLDFIADFADWNNAINPHFLDLSRKLTIAAARSMGSPAGDSILAFDPFAGGGAIPTEAIRLGLNVYASDLNPLPVLLNKIVIDYAPRFGTRLANAVRHWGQWVFDNAEKELQQLYPIEEENSLPVAYLWARTVLSESPEQTGDPVEIPLLRTLWLCKKDKKKIALRWSRNAQGEVVTQRVQQVYSDGSRRYVRRPILEIFLPQKERDVESGTVVGGSATCPITGFVTKVKSVRKQLGGRTGGTADARLICVVSAHTGRPGRSYRVPTDLDIQAVSNAQEMLIQFETTSQDSLSTVPDELISTNELRRISVPLYGMKCWRDIFTPRQLLALTSVIRFSHQAASQLRKTDEKDFADALQTCLALVVGKFAQYNSSLCRWKPTGESLVDTFGRQALGMVWDFAESNPFAGASGDFYTQIEWHANAIENVSSFASNVNGTVAQASADEHPLPNDCAQVLFTDPPYYDAVPYSHLSDFFYVWLRRMLIKVHPSLFDGPEAPKAREIVVDRPHRLSKSKKDIAFYEKSLTNAFTEARRITTPDGIASIVFASKTTASWEAFLQAVVSGGWVITGSWPIDTEMTSRVSAQGQARLASSVHLVCRPRETSDGELITDKVGDWRDVLTALPERIKTWMPRLASEGVVGADAIFACLGPALEVFSTFSRVEKVNGESVSLREYLEHVWAAISHEALLMVFKDADALGLEPDARLTAMWLWTLNAGARTSSAELTDTDFEAESDEDIENDEDSQPVVSTSGYTLEYDAARKISQGLGVHLDKAITVVEIKKDKARLFSVKERAQYLFGRQSIIDDSPATKKGEQKGKARQINMFPNLDRQSSLALEDAAPDKKTQQDAPAPEIEFSPGETVLDRLHQSMILFADGRGGALRKLLVEDGVGKDARVWKLAQSLSALYPAGSDEKRWVDGVLARKKGLGF